MPIALYFGSFNPIHIGHLIIANHILNEGAAEKIWFVVSPQNPFKKSASLMNEFDRLHLVQKAIATNDRLKATDIEFTLPKPSYTATTLNYLREKHPSQQFKILMGSDSFQNLGNWMNVESIIKNHAILVYKRPGFEIDNKYDASIRILAAPLLDISATAIRELVTQGKSIRYLVPDTIEEDIVTNRFFQNLKKVTKQ